MMRKALPLVALTGIVGFLLGLVAAGRPPAGQAAASALARPAAAIASQPTAAAVSAATDVAPVVGAGIDFAAVAARLNGAVVNVDAAARDDGSRTARRWRRDFADENGTPREGSGSGFIIDAAGFILTNHHVIEGADRITVTLGDGRAFRAAVVGVDPAIDVALLQVEPRGPLPVAPLGTSDDLRVGEWVCAIGNPLGYVHSVTVGVVSFIGRKLFDPSLDAFIQTDAAISFGNSGGPLINSRGQVVGITTAISAQASNIGFAIPIAQVLSVLPQLRERGRVARGFIGVGLTTATPQLQRALRLGVERGALVQDVAADSPADRAGLRSYDVITRADDRVVRSDDELIRYIASRQPGEVTRLEVSRDGVSKWIPVKLAERPLVEAARRTEPGSSSVRPAAGQEQGPLGLTVRDLDAAAYRRHSIPDALVGVLIVDVEAAGPARQARLRRSQVLLEINRHRVASVAEYRQVVAALEPGAAVALLVYDPVTDQRAIYAVIIDPAS